jgi:hypothetical protein
LAGPSPPTILLKILCLLLKSQLGTHCRNTSKLLLASSYYQQMTYKLKLLLATPRNGSLIVSYQGILVRYIDLV